MTGFSWRRAVLAAFLASGGMAAEGRAQAFTLASGARLFDGERATMAALRSELPIGTAVLVEFASSVSEVPAGARAVGSVFEAQVQLPIGLGDVLTPYLGAGAGLGHVSRASGDGGEWQGVLSLSAGMRVAFAEQLGLVLDARMRGVGSDLVDGHTDVTVGLRYQLNRPDRPRFRGAPRPRS